MTSNVERFRGDLDKLIALGDQLRISIEHECFPGELEKVLKKKLDDKTVLDLKALPRFSETYQHWYSEAIVLLRQLLPDRVPDFIRHYEKPKPRKDITYDSYRIEDYLQGLTVTFGYEKKKIVGPDAAIPHFQQQLAIVKAAKSRFESSLFEIRQLVQADLFDSELEAAEELIKFKFARAAGALAGVVLEGHLAQVCSDRKIPVTKKNPTISDFNEILKAQSIIDIPLWRFIQHLADIRNLCDHSKKPDPKDAQVADLIDGVKKVIKTVF